MKTHIHLPVFIQPLVALLASGFCLLLAVPQSTAAIVFKVSAGNSHSLFVKNDGSLWTMGWNSNGQLGDGTTMNRSTPVQIATSTTIIAVAAGSTHSLFVTSDGKLWAMGSNTFGQLGDGTTIDRPTPVQIATGATVTDVAAGNSYSLFVTNDGKLWAMGYNQLGQLGDGTTTNRSTPVRITTSATVTAVVAGGSHSLFVTSDGKLWAMGYNSSGQLGDGTTTSRSTPVQISTSGTVTAIAAGGSHSLFITSNGRLWAMGSNHDGQLGIGYTYGADQYTPAQITTSATVTVAAAGGSHSLFATSDGKLWAMGSHSSGQLGNGIISSNFGLIQWTPVQITTSTTVVAAAAGGAHSLFVTSDSKLWGMGSNQYGQLGIINGGAINYSTPTLLVEINETSAPTITTNPQNVTVIAGQNTTATFTVAASGNPTYQWQSSLNGSGWTNISGATTTALTLNAVTVAMNGMLYRCTVTNSQGSTVSTTAKLTVYADQTTATAQQFKTQLETPGIATVTVTGAINLSLVGGATVTSGKTIIGADATSTITGGLTIPATASDVVILGVNFTNGTLTIVGAHDVHITHCTFTDTPIAITGGADNVSFSWNHFTATSAGTGSGMTINGTGATSGIGIILDHNLWGDGLRSNMPSVTNARVFMFNNYFTAAPTAGNTNATIADTGAQILSQNNIYQGVNNPLMQQSTGLIFADGNFIIATTGSTAPGTNTVFVPAWSQVMQPAGIGTPLNANTLAKNITANAGNTAGKNSFTPAQTNGTAAVTATVTGAGATANATGATVPDSTSFTLKANATGFSSNPASWQWYRNNFPITNATAPTYNVPTATPADAGNYSVAIITTAGDIVTAPAFTVTITSNTGTNNNGNNGGNNGGNNNNTGGSSGGGGGGGAPSLVWLGAIAALITLRRVAHPKITRG